MEEPWYVRKARLAQQRNPQKHPVQLEIGEPMKEHKHGTMTLEQKMTLKAILEGDYDIYGCKFEFVADTNWLSLSINGELGTRRHVRIMPDGKITQQQQVEVKL